LSRGWGKVRGIVVGVKGEIGKLRGVDVVVESGRVVGVRGTGKLVIKVVFVVGNGLVGTPLNDKPAVLNKRLILVESNRLDAGNCGFSDRQLSPVVAGNDSAGCK
jgi:hypothetical protein